MNARSPPYLGVYTRWLSRGGYGEEGCHPLAYYLPGLRLEVAARGFTLKNEGFHRRRHDSPGGVQGGYD